MYGQLIAILLCYSTMFQIRQLLLIKKKRELIEYKAIYMIKDYFLLLFRAIQKDTQELSKLLLRLFNLLHQNGRKSHRYKKKTVFDILDVVYDFTMSHNHVTQSKKLKPNRVYFVCRSLKNLHWTFGKEKNSM